MEKKMKAKKPAGKIAEKRTEKPVQAQQAEKKAAHAKKDKAILKMQRLIKRKHLPIFRGRFGVKSIRRKGIEKWQKWRRPRGEDIQRTQEDGAYPKTGYRTSHETRFLHPSGYMEALVRNVRELGGLENRIVRIASSVGRKKRKQIIAEAKKAGLRIAN